MRLWKTMLAKELLPNGTFESLVVFALGVEYLSKAVANAERERCVPVS